MHRVLISKKESILTNVLPWNTVTKEMVQIHLEVSSAWDGLGVALGNGRQMAECPPNSFLPL